MKKIFYLFLFLVCLQVIKAQEPIVVETGNPAAVTPEKKESTIPKNKIKLGVSGGFSFLTGAIASDLDPLLKDHIRNLKTGFHVGADIDFFITRHLALGAKYALFGTRDEINNVLFQDNSGHTFSGKLDERIFVHYVGPNIFLKVGKATGKVFFTLDGSLGCLIYRNSGVYGTSDYTMKGETFGVAVMPGIDIKITQQLAINLSAGLTFGIMNRATMTVNGQTETQNELKENLSRIDLSIGLRWYK